MQSVNEWFFLRDGFESFRLEPDKHRQLLFGRLDRDQRDHLLNRIEEACYSLEGHKSVVFGDFGRGKTHQCKNIIWQVGRLKLPVYPVYVKCTEYKAKESFSSFFRELLLALPTNEIQAMSEEYARRIRQGAPRMSAVTGSEELGLIFEKGLSAPNLDLVRLCVRYLGGEDKINLSSISDALPARLNISKEFGGVMKGFVHLFHEIGINGARVPLFLVDEAERFSTVTNVDAYWTWVAALRELTEINGMGIVFFVGAKTQDTIPEMLVIDEVRTRIGVINYVEFWNPDKNALRDFISDLTRTLIRKGSIPPEHRDALMDLGVDVAADRPQELRDVASDDDAMESFPFSRDALDEFVESCAQADLANKPREVLIRLQRAATKAIRKNERPISVDTVQEIVKEAGV
jgi:hypothetical protein